MKPKYLICLFFFIILPGCQTTKKIDSKASLNSDPIPLVSIEPWFESARLGDWNRFESLQKKLNRPWSHQHKNGQTALMMAARNGQLEFVEKLLSKKIKINEVDVYNYNALSYALHGPKPIEVKKSMCQLLIQNGADAFSEDHLQLTPIQIMIEFGFKDCIRLVRLTNIRPCDQSDRLNHIPSLVSYAEKEEEFEIQDYLKSQGCP